jgi:hypothetical protein
MNRASTTFSTFAAVLLLATFGVGADNSGCQSTPSSSVKTETIRTNYWMFYKSETDTSYARAQFRVGSDIGTTLELTDGSKAAFDEKTLAWNSLIDWYELNLAGKVTAGTWSFTDNLGKTYTNKLPSSLEARIPEAFPASIPQSEAFDLQWDGEPVQEDETMEVIVAHDENRLQFFALFEKAVGAKNFVIPPTEWKKLPLGRTAIVLQRHRDHALEQGTGAGGKILTTFESPLRIFDLK